MTTYYTIGDVRGSCGHQHRTVDAAQRCLDRDASACRKQGGYSDRVIRAIPDDDEPRCQCGAGLVLDDIEHQYGCSRKMWTHGHATPDLSWAENRDAGYITD